MEASICRLAATNATRSDIARLRQTLKQENDPLHRLPQPEWVRLASSFHLDLGKAAGKLDSRAISDRTRLALLADCCAL